MVYSKIISIFLKKQNREIIKESDGIGIHIFKEKKTVEIQFNTLFRISNAVETDLLERELHNNRETPISIIDSNKFNLDFKKFEIKTIKLTISINK